MSRHDPPRPGSGPMEVAKRLSQDLGPQVRRLREARGMTQLDLGNAAYLTADHVGKIERAIVCPNIGTVGQIAAGLRVPVAHLLDPHGEAQLAEAPDPLVELVRYLRQRRPEDSAFALIILRQVFDHYGPASPAACR